MTSMTRPTRLSVAARYAATTVRVPDLAYERVTVAEDGCWLWTGKVGSNGYGRVHHSDGELYAHRLFFAYYNGLPADGLQLDHLCRVRHCVRVDHLEAVTARENVLRGQSACADNAKKAECVHGHSLSDAYVLTRRNGERVCRECSRQRASAARAKRRADRAASV